MFRHRLRRAGMRPASLVMVSLAVALLAGAAHAAEKAGKTSTSKRADKPAPTDIMTQSTSGPRLPLLFTDLVAFSTDDHRRLTLQAQRSSYAFAAGTNMLPLTIAEMPIVVRHYPMVFVQEGAAFGLVALVGLPGGGNRFVDAKGQWRAGTYIPSYVRGYPFIAVRPAPDAQPVIAFDPNAEEFKAAGGLPLIGADGQPSEAMKFIISFQTEFSSLMDRTRSAVQALHDAGVLEAGHLTVRQPDGETASFDGFLVVNETKLRELKPAAFKRLSDADALGLAYAQLMSLGNLEQLQLPAVADGRQPLPAAPRTGSQPATTVK